jgi:hypothetical protein
LALKRCTKQHIATSAAHTTLKPLMKAKPFQYTSSTGMAFIFSAVVSQQ